MTRMSKQGERRNRSPRRPKLSGPKTGPKKECFVVRDHANALDNQEMAKDIFIPKIK